MTGSDLSASLAQAQEEDRLSEGARGNSAHVLPIVQAVAARRRGLLRALLQASGDTAAVVQVQLMGGSAANAAAVAVELGQVVASNQLQARAPAVRQL